MMNRAEVCKIASCNFPDTPHSAEQVIGSFLDLPEGWHYGEGRNATKAAYRTALEVDRLFQNSKARIIEAFPDLDGGVSVCGRYENEDLEVFCSPDGLRLSLCHEVDDVPACEVEDVTIEDVRDYINGLHGMEAIRLLHPQFYSKDRQRFESRAFRNSNDGSGVSVFCVCCARERSGAECRHVRLHYFPSPSGNPPVLWRIDTEKLPEGAIAKQDPTDNDTCHMNLKGLSNNQFKSLIRRSLDVNDLETCEDDCSRQLTREDINRFPESSAS